MEQERQRLENTYVMPGETDAFMGKVGGAPLKNKTSLADMLKRPEITYENLAEIDPDRPALSDHVTTQMAVQIKYEGYIHRQTSEVLRHAKLESRELPADLDYKAISGLRIEAAQKLSDRRPATVGQASRISGVSPADISVLLIYLGIR